MHSLNPGEYTIHKEFWGSRMMDNTTLSKQKKLALIAHDACKQDLLEWASFNQDVLKDHQLFGTGTTGKMIADGTNLSIHHFRRIQETNRKMISSKLLIYNMMINNGTALAMRFDIYKSKQ